MGLLVSQTATSANMKATRFYCVGRSNRSEEHTSELQSRLHLVCRLLLEKNNNHPAFSQLDKVFSPRLSPLALISSLLLPLVPRARRSTREQRSLSPVVYSLLLRAATAPL